MRKISPLLGREERLTESYLTYQIAVAGHAKTFPTGYAAKYAAYVTYVSAEDADATQDFAQSERALSDHDAGFQNTWNTDDTTSLQDFYVLVANVRSTHRARLKRINASS